MSHSHSHSRSRSHSTQPRRPFENGVTHATFAWIARMMGLRTGMPRREWERREAARRQRREELRQQRDRFTRSSHGQSLPVDEIRSRVTLAQQNGERVSTRILHELAEKDGVHISRGHWDLRPELVARIAYLRDRYYFLGHDGRFYYSTNPTGNGPDFDISLDTYTPILIRQLAYPYRQLCRR
ncbi:hypothetical protein F5Y00DRAFT_274472 [Daldinia vernicosa]|uniref:uncharacterized protein n=1 Tax=Daldinia vernicosa TaxID=114800 RepID=UPI002008CEF1|nr:uncharacterized protein F5Y00DRAFT_274472 [Daldinia vernicosa]KAI0844075.1 hypothetical protein F5Y00DRAFT_274472 [Daldinia vernicosa]